MPGRSSFTVFVLGVVAAILVMLAPAAAQAQDPGPAYDDWNAEQIGYPSNAPRSNRAECIHGSDRCIDRTIGEMYRRFNAVVPTCDDNNVFALTYLRVTEDIRNGVDEGFYPDEFWLNRLDALFARPYFLAYDNYQAGRTALIPAAWRIAFDAGRDGTVEGLGNLLLSMNAHVNRDFPFVLYQVGLTRPDGGSRKAEHDSGNERLRALYRPMIDELTRRFDESMDDYDLPGTADDEALFDVLVLWRETAWQNALRLAAAKNDAERRQVAQSIEAYSVAVAESIYAGLSYLPGESRAARDAHCAANGGQDPSYGRGADVAHFRSRKAVLTGERQIVFPVRCPNGPGPCVGTASTAGGGASKSFEVPAGERRSVRLPVGFGPANGDRIRVKLKSLLGPGVEQTKRRALRAKAG